MIQSFSIKTHMSSPLSCNKKIKTDAVKKSEFYHIVSHCKESIIRDKDIIQWFPDLDTKNRFFIQLASILLEKTTRANEVQFRKRKVMLRWERKCLFDAWIVSFWYHWHRKLRYDTLLKFVLLGRNIKTKENPSRSIKYWFNKQSQKTLKLP